MSSDTKEIIAEDEVQRVAALARLHLTDAEVSQATRNLSGVLTNFSDIQEVDTGAVSPSEDVSGLSNIARKDEARENILCSSEDLLARVPLKKGRHVQVRAVL